jgi:hypothetical protein
MGAARICLAKKSSDVARGPREKKKIRIDPGEIL